jgi:putative ABC transport system permease protein
LKKHNPKPPALAQKTLLRFLRDDLADEVLGDLNEKFYSSLKTKSLLKAKLGYWYQVINYASLCY